MCTTGAHGRRAVTHIVVHITKMFPNVCSDIASMRAAFEAAFLLLAAPATRSMAGGGHRGHAGRSAVHRRNDSAEGARARAGYPRPTPRHSRHSHRHAPAACAAPVIAGDYSRIPQLSGGLIRSGVGGATMRGSRSSAGGRARRAAPRPQ